MKVVKNSVVLVGRNDPKKKKKKKTVMNGKCFLFTTRGNSTHHFSPFFFSPKIQIQTPKLPKFFPITFFYQFGEEKKIPIWTLEAGLFYEVVLINEDSFIYNMPISW
uniref:Uncharacterized protein n=1 Tax=Cacopsylla melanoneura TaxID=428564 RepID=A0A8D8RLQ3_9HEMI